MSVSIESFSPTAASNSELLEFYDLSMSVISEEFPGQPVPAFDDYARQLRAGTSLLGDQRLWAAREHGRIVGVATLVLPGFENSHVALVTVRVRPDARRRGVGRELLRASIDSSRSEARGLISAQSLKVAGEGMRWAANLGFETVHQYVLQRLDISAVDPGLWRVSAPDGVRLQRWVDHAPQELVSSYAVARTAIADAPVGDSEFRFPEWTVERVRQHEKEIQARGDAHWVVVAVDEGSGAVAGLTEMLLTPHRPELGIQQETAVLPAYRGRSLGRLVKAEMMQWLTADRPEIRSVVTNTAADNAHMIRVNHQIGYVTDFTVADMEAPAERVRV